MDKIDLVRRKMEKLKENAYTIQKEVTFMLENCLNELHQIV